MSTRYHKRFFERVTTQSGIKLRVYQTYLSPWAAKLGSNPRNKLLWVVDGFAGRGRYEDGSPGSPERALQLARDVAQQERGYRIQCIFGETRTSNQSVLYELGGLYPAGSAMIIENDFWSRVEQVVELVGESPALVFVDPFGLASLKFDRLRVLVTQLRQSDFIINFRSPAAPRLAAKMGDRITAAVGGPDWTVDTVGLTFRNSLQIAGGFLKPASLSIRERLGGAVHSELILASRHPDAYELWNDQIIKEVERLDADEAIGDTMATRDRNIDEVVRRLEQWAPRGRAWRRQDAVSWHVVEHCGDAHSGTVKRAHAQLVNRGKFRSVNPNQGIEQQLFERN